MLTSLHFGRQFAFTKVVNTLQLVRKLLTSQDSQSKVVRTMSGVTLLDGGSATELFRLGHAQLGGLYEDNNPLWSAAMLHTAPEDVKSVHKRYVEAGSDIIETVSYQASVQGFQDQFKLSEEEAMALIGKSVLLAKQACEEVHKEKGTPLAKVSGSVGAYGACLCDGSEYTGTYVETMSAEELQAWHRPRIKALLDAGADLLAIETMPSWREALAVVQLLEKDFPEAKASVSFSCVNGPETTTNHKEPFVEAVKSVHQSKNVVAVGTNCCYPQFITPLLQSLKGEGIEKPILVKPNSGEPWLEGVGWVPGENKHTVPGYIAEWLENGASWIGGCCRVTPEEIGEMRQKLSQLGKI